MAQIVGYIPPVKKAKRPGNKPASPDKDTGKDKKNSDKEASE